jgi:hypothetical protein
MAAILDAVAISVGPGGELTVAGLPDDRALASMLHALLTSDADEARLVAEGVGARRTSSIDLAGVRFVGDQVILFDVADDEREVPPPAFDRLMARWLRALGSLPTPPVPDATRLADALDARAGTAP